MSKFSETAGGVGAIASGASSLFGAISSIGAAKRQRNLMDYQYKKEAAYQKEMAAHNWNNYNSPAAQRRSMEAAGINPFVGDSSVAGMQMDSNSAGPDLQDAADPLGGFASNIHAGASSLFQMSEQRRVNDSVIKMNEANANKAQADANQTNMMLPGNLDLQELDKQLKTIAGANDELRNQLLTIEAKYKERQTLLGLQQMQQEIDESLSRVQLNGAEKKVKEKMLEQIDASIREANSRVSLNQAKTRTEGYVQDDLTASANLKSQQRESEVQRTELIRSERGLTVKKASQIDAEIERLGRLNKLTDEEVDLVKARFWATASAEIRDWLLLPSEIVRNSTSAAALLLK